MILSDESPILLDAIRKCGRRVPEDVSLVTYESRGVSAFQNPPLTTLEYDYARLVSSALLELDHAMNGKETKSRIIVPGKLNVRGSTGPHVS